MRLALLGLLASGLVVGLGCRDGGDDETASGGSGTGGSTSSNPDTTTTTTSAQGGNGVGGEGGSGGLVGCIGPDHTIQDITTDAVGKGTKVTVKGVVAMSQKFLVSKSSSGSCLWGVFISAPGLTETAPNTGILALSYGTPAEIPEGGNTAFCPRLGQDPAGDKIPDNVKPGDVLDMIGVADAFPSMPTCNSPNPDNQVAMRQLSQVCSATITGTAAVPTPKVISGADIAKLSSTTDEAFHDQWGGVKVRIQNVGAIAESPDVDLNGTVVHQYGVIKLATGGTGTEVGDKIYYRPYSDNKCHEGPTYMDPAVMFERVDGFHYLNFCSWGLQVNDKCADAVPSSPDCAAATTCPPDTL